MSDPVKMRPLWCREPCWTCGIEGYATRTQPKPADAPYYCEGCVMHERGRESAIAEARAHVEALLALLTPLERNPYDRDRAAMRAAIAWLERTKGGGDGT